MFKKVQIKFFAFTAGILLALIAAVLISINIIMETIVENQSRVILKQIAASIEYDEKTSTFTYFEKKGPPPEHDPINDMRPTEKSSQPPETAPSETESTEALTENPTQNTTQKNNQTTYEETQENDPPKITSPIQTNTESQTTAQTETQSVHTEKPAETTGNFQQPTAPPEWDPDFNHKPPEWENPPDPYGPNDISRSRLGKLESIPKRSGNRNIETADILCILFTQLALYHEPIRKIGNSQSNICFAVQ